VEEGRRGKDVSIADIQAMLRYYEKRLYGDLGARQSADISYEEAAKRVVGTAGGRLAQGGLDEVVPVGEKVFNTDQTGEGQPGEVFYQTGSKPLGLYSAVTKAVLTMKLPAWKPGGSATGADIFLLGFEDITCCC
tara:strand:+ start:6502 stop:6906 length:405 start_codon:yes stop_codon:yes gene_type:complete